MLPPTLLEVIGASSAKPAPWNAGVGAARPVALAPRHYVSKVDDPLAERHYKDARKLLKCGHEARAVELLAEAAARGHAAAHFQRGLLCEEGTSVVLYRCGCSLRL